MAVRRCNRARLRFALAVVLLMPACSRDATQVKRAAGETRPAPARTAPGSSEGAMAELEAISLSGLDGVIVSAAAAERQLGSAHAGSYWNPSQANVAAFEAMLVPTLRANPPPGSPALWRKVNKYKRQYVGAQSSGRLVLIAYLHCQVPDDWHQRVYVVDDGGDCHVEVTYDIAASRIVGVIVNAEA